MSAPPLIAVCQHPYGEAYWFPVDGPGERCCIPECDCVPVVYVRKGAQGDEVNTSAQVARDLHEFGPYGGDEAA